MNIIDKWFWKIQNPSPLDSIVRGEDRKDKTFSKIMFLFGCGLMCLFLLGLILMGK